MGLRESQIDSAQASCDILTKEVSNSGDVQESSSTLKSGIGFALAFMIYIFIFVYGTMVMRSAMEEKTNRIVEVIVSSVKPFHLMMGKILGVAAVGLTQFVAWILLAVGLVMGISAMFLNSGGGMTTQQAVQKGIEARTGMATVGAMGGDAVQVGATGSEGARDLAAEFTEPLSNLPYFEIIGVFLLFFVGGYLLNGSDGSVKTPRELMGIGSDRFVVMMNAANKGIVPNRKSFGENLLAFSLFAKNHDDALLYLHTEQFGAMGGIDLVKLVNAVGIPEHQVKFVDQFAYRNQIPNHILAGLYSMSDVLLAVSMGEGFGIPVIEAQACGTPVIVSDWTAQPELCTISFEMPYMSGLYPSFSARRRSRV